MIDVESIDMKRRSVMTVMVHWRMRLIQRILMKVCIVFGFIQYHYAVDSRDLGGEIGRSFPGLR